MSVDRPSKIYREQLSSLHRGLALWDPKPVEGLHRQPGHVSIGDVGYLDNGAFMRMFNVTLPGDDPSNTVIGRLEEYVPLNAGGSDIVRARAPLDQTVYHTRHVSEVDNVLAHTQADALGQMYQCKARHHGALLSLPLGGFREDVIRVKLFENYIKDNAVDWFRWSKEMMLPVEHMEDLILVTGCTLVASWAAAVFDGRTTASLEAINSGDSGAQYVWRNIRGNVEYHNSRFDPNVQGPPPQNQCVFIRGFRAKRRFFRTIVMRAAAEPHPDDPDDRREDEIQVTRIPDSSKWYQPRDPLVGVLDYIIRNQNAGICTRSNTSMTSDLIEEFLREKQMPLVVENGVANLVRHPAENEPPVTVSEEKKAISHAVSELNGEPVPLVIHPALTKYNLKLDSSDHDYGLPKEINAPAEYSPMLSQLEGHQGYPQIITVEASVDSRGIGATVQDVLVQTIHENMRLPFPGRELSELTVEERAGINATLGETCKSVEELSKGPRRIDLLGGRDKIQILPKFAPNGSELTPTSTLPTLALQSGRILE